MSTNFYPLPVKKINRETADTVSISFDVKGDLGSTFNFVPGQYLTLKTTIKGEEVRRSYSICSAPHEEDLTVSVKEIENGVFSGYANQVLKEGDVLDVMAPTGNFKIETNPTNNKRYVFYAAGSGITPILSMIKAILKSEENSKIELYYGNRTAADTIFKSVIDGLNAENDHLSVHYVYSREDSGNANTNGHIDATKCGYFMQNGHADLSIDGVYACGPEQMIMTVKDFYLDKGLSKDKIHFELFTTSVPTENVAVESGAPINSEVTVIIDDEEYSFSLMSTGKDILQAAQDEDADVPFSCKGGVCCTCRAKVMEGTVKMDLNFALEEDEVADGFILTCQSHPTSEKVVVSFDEY